MKKSDGRFFRIVTLMLVSSLLLLSLLAGCGPAAQRGDGENEPSAQNTEGLPGDKADVPDSGEDSREETKDDDPSVGSETSPDDVSDTESDGAAPGFIRGMGCDDVNCTSTKHYHDCPADCANYDHYHHCELDCTVASHDHHRYTLPVESDKKS